MLGCQCHGTQITKLSTVHRVQSQEPSQLQRLAYRTRACSPVRHKPGCRPRSSARRSSAKLTWLPKQRRTKLRGLLQRSASGSALRPPGAKRRSKRRIRLRRIRLRRSPPLGKSGTLVPRCAEGEPANASVHTQVAAPLHGICSSVRLGQCCSLVHNCARCSSIMVCAGGLPEALADDAQILARCHFLPVWRLLESAVADQRPAVSLLC